MKLNHIKENIIKTLLFFLIRFRPLKLNELYLYLYSNEKVSLKSLKQNLEELIAKKIITEKD
jgi:hypothetical protein